MNLSPLEPRDRVLFLGKTGSGKSHACKQLLARELKGGTRVVAFDVHDEYSKHGRASGQVTLGPLTQRVTVGELVQDHTLLDREDLALSVVPTLTAENGRERRIQCAHDFRYLAGQVQDTGELLFVIEEVGFFGEEASHDLIDVACQFRHCAVSVAMVAQCAVMVPKKARRQMSQLYTGRQDDPEDLDAIAKLTRDDDFAERVARLQPREILHWRDTFEKGS